MNNELMNPLAGPLTTAARQAPTGDTIKQPIRNPLLMRDRHGNDMTRTNAMKAQLGEAPVGASVQNPLTLSTAPETPAPKKKSVLDGGFTGRMYDQNGISRERAAAYKNLPVFESAANEAVPNLASFPKPAPSLHTIEPGVQERTFNSISPGQNPLTARPQEAGVLNAAQGQKENSFSETGINPLTVFGPLDAHGNSLAATNEMKARLEEMTRTAPANVTTLENSGLKESQALMDKWGRQDMQREMLQEIGRNPRAAGAIAGLAADANSTEAEMRRQDVASLVNQRNAETTQRGQDVVAETERRGQDSRATVEGNRLAGNPLDNQLKGVQLKSEQAALARAQEQDKAIAAIRAEQDPVKRQAMIEAHLAGQGKNPLTDRYIKVDGGEEIGPDGKIKRPSGVFDVATKQFIPMNPAQGDQSAVPPPDKRVVGQKYQTPKGPMIWRGTGWEAA